MSLGVEPVAPGTRGLGARRGLAGVRAGHWLLFFVAAYSIAAFAAAPAVYLALIPVHGTIFWLYVPAALLVGLLLASSFENPRNPVTATLAVARTRAGALALVVAAAFPFTIAFTTFKTGIPEAVPFYGDPVMADIDEWLHGGAPWTHLHRIGGGWVAEVVALTYGKLWFLQWFSLPIQAALWARDPRHLRYLWALALTMVTAGTVLATCLSSVGPVFYDAFYGGTRFTGLTSTIANDPAGRGVLFYAGYLLENHRAGTAALGTGISAMPSVHVAIAVLNAFYMASFGRWLGIAGWGFAAIILFGSVYTGWHYAIDGYVSILVVALVWRATRFLAAGAPRAGWFRRSWPAA